MREFGENPKHRPVLSVYEDTACGESRSLGETREGEAVYAGILSPKYMSQKTYDVEKCRPMGRGCIDSGKINLSVKGGMRKWIMQHVHNNLIETGE